MGEHGAARDDGVDRAGLEGERAHVGGIDVEHERDGVAESARAAGARRVHALLEAAAQVDDLGVLAAELDRGVGFRVGGFEGAGGGDDLLDEGNPELLGDADGRRSGEGDANVCVAEAVLHVVDDAREGASDVGVVPVVAGEERRSVFIKDN